MAAESFGIGIPGNRSIGSRERERRLDLYYRPYRNAVEAAIRHASRVGVCWHLSIHSFSPVANGVPRRAETGVLYDPRRSIEARAALALSQALSREGFRSRRNYPYRGTSDGLTTHFRRLLPAPSYAGMELEINQALLGTARQRTQFAARIARAVAEVYESGAMGSEC
jgi:predicted N-formylglutamate amidohydrolase